jgi:transcriptional regulator with XRE-family HTH domain
MVIIQAEIGCQLRLSRQELGLSQIEVATLSNLSERQYQGLEAGDHLPRIDTLFQLATALRVSVFDLLGPAWDKYLAAYVDAYIPSDDTFD